MCSLLHCTTLVSFVLLTGCDRCRVLHRNRAARSPACPAVPIPIANLLSMLYQPMSFVPYLRCTNSEQRIYFPNCGVPETSRFFVRCYGTKWAAGWTRTRTKSARAETHVSRHWESFFVLGGGEIGFARFFTIQDGVFVARNLCSQPKSAKPRSEILMNLDDEPESP